MPTRRGKHEGTISQRADGRWEARITVQGGRKSFYGPTRKAVQAKLREALHDQAQGLPIVPEKITVGQFLQQYLKTSATRTDTPTQERYEAQVRLYLEPELGNVLLARLDAKRVQDFYDALGATLAPGSIRMIHALLHQALKHAVRLRLVQYNVSEQVILPSPRDSKIEPFTEEEGRRFLAAIEGHRDEALFVLAITTGMRQGELLGLQWDHIDWQEGQLHIAQAARSVRGEAGGRRVRQLAKPKTKESQRTVTLCDLALSALRRQETRLKSEKFAIGPDWKSTGLVFPDEWGEVMSRQKIYHRFKNVLREANLPDRRFHDLRHTTATILLSHGLDLKQVSEMLGHADVTMTLTVYGHVLPSMHRAAADMMDQVFAKKRS